MGRGGSGPFQPQNSGPSSFFHHGQRRSPSGFRFARTSRMTDPASPGMAWGASGGAGGRAVPGAGAASPLGCKQIGFPPGASMHSGPWPPAFPDGAVAGEGGGEGFGGGGSRNARASQSSWLHGFGSGAGAGR